ncbi:MAG: glycosyl hydrolase family 38 [Verrucomicrobia bacterium]|nr:glycosyl hydrolase family 38 [Verrucomicrobiota bacterium]
MNSMIRQLRLASSRRAHAGVAGPIAAALALAALSGEGAVRVQSATFECAPKILRTDRGERWVVTAHLDSPGLSNVTVTASAASWGQTQPQPKGSLAPGKTTLEFEIPPLQAGEPLRIRLHADAGTQDFEAATLSPPKRWTVYLTQHTHTDIGYTRPQTEILPESLRFLDNALDYCDLTDDYPDDAKFRWTCETFWAVREFLKSRPPAQLERLKRRVHEGRIEITGLLLNLSEIATESSIVASLQNLHALGGDLRLPVVGTMQNDVNGAAWCLPDLLPGIGIRYLTMGINKTRSIVPFDQPTVFWWEAPSGRRMLAYRADHYHLGNFWGIHTGDTARFGAGLINYLQSLQRRHYPYDRAAVQFSGYHTDNSPPSTIASDLVRRWNEHYAWPKLRLSVAREFPESVERQHGNTLPVHRQAWPDWWTDGFGSAARETAASRETHAALQVTEALLAMSTLRGRTIPEAVLHAVAQAQEDLMFYDEHTFGAAESVDDPLAENSQVQWNEKSAYLWTAVKEAHLLREDAFGLFQESLPRAQVPTLAVVNTLNWPRSGLAHVFVDRHLLPPDREFRIVDAQTGDAVPVQALNRRPEGAYWAIWTRNIPPLGYRLFRIETSDRPRTAETTAALTSLENAFYELRIDPDSGAVIRLVDKETGRNLVDPAAPWGFNQLFRETLTEKRDFVPDRFRRTAWTNITAQPAIQGPVWKSIALAGRLEGCAEKHGARAEIRLYETEKRVEFHWSIRKLPVPQAEAVYVAFPFAPKDGQIVYEAQGGVARPGLDQIPGSASDWQTVQSFLAVRHPGGQIVWGSAGAPLVQLGEINLGKWQPVTRVPQPHVYSWVMNNYWFTNFRPTQEGDFRWSYFLTTTPDRGNPAPTRFSWGSRLPLATRVLPPVKSLKSQGPAALSLVSIDVPGVLVVDTRPAAGGGILMHLREVAGETTTLDLDNVKTWTEIESAAEVNALGHLVEDGIESFVLKPFDVRFVRLRFAPPET